MPSMISEVAAKIAATKPMNSPIDTFSMANYIATNTTAITKNTRYEAISVTAVVKVSLKSRLLLFTPMAR